MKHIIAGTNRPNSRTLEIAKLLERQYRARGEEIRIIDLREVGLTDATGAEYGDGTQPQAMRAACADVVGSDGLIVVCPEYNGSMPGALKYFMDHWAYPAAWEYRPVCFVGLGGRFGGLRPVEHLQQVFGYRNAFQYPERVFITDVWTKLKDGEIHDPQLVALLESQTNGFIRFVAALKKEKLDANSRRA